MLYVMAGLILLLSFLLAREIEIKKENHQEKVLGEEVVTSFPTPSPSSTTSPYPTKTPTPTPTPTPSSSSTSSSVSIKQEVKDESSNSVNFSLSDLIYPNSNQIERDKNNMSLESGDDPKTITDWYKDKIRNLGFKSKSFVQTSTNGNILNKLVGASSNKQVKVEIEKKTDESKSHIRVEFSAT